jgi:hypothetical protein
MHDLAYVAAGYAATGVAIGGYRWRLAVRLRRARRYVATVSRPVTGRGRA